MFFFPICPKDTYANIVSESMHDVPLMFEFCLLCILQEYVSCLSSLWIKSSVLWSCTSGPLGRITGFQGKWSAGWSQEVKRLCVERGGQHSDFEGTAVLKGWDWTAWIGISALSEQIALWPPARIISAALSGCQPWPGNPKSLLHNTFSPSSLFGKCKSLKQLCLDRYRLCFAKGGRLRLKDNSCHLKLRKQQQVKHIVLSAQYSTYCSYLSSL